MPEFILHRKRDSKKDRKNRDNSRKYSRSSGGFASRISVEEDPSTPKEILKPVSHFNSFDKQERDVPRKKFLAKRTSNKQDLFLVVCSKCGEHCEVPFKPSNSRPIYCSNCFKKSDSLKSTPSQAKEIKEKLDRIIELLGER